MANKDMKRKYIVDMAIQCLAENPRSNLSDIAGKAGIGIATLHRYFESREKLILEIAYNAIDIVNKAINSLELDGLDVKDYFLKLSAALIPLGDKIYFLNNESFLEYDSEFMKEENKIWQGIIKKIEYYQVGQELRSDIKAEWIFHIYYTLLFSIWQEIQNGNVALNNAHPLLVSVMLQGISVNTNQEKANGKVSV